MVQFLRRPGNRFLVEDKVSGQWRELAEQEIMTKVNQSLQGAAHKRLKPSPSAVPMDGAVPVACPVVAGLAGTSAAEEGPSRGFVPGASRAPDPAQFDLTRDYLMGNGGRT
jgi:hypothetical protein